MMLNSIILKMLKFINILVLHQTLSIVRAQTNLLGGDGHDNIQGNIIGGGDHDNWNKTAGDAGMLGKDGHGLPPKWLDDNTTTNGT